MRSSFALRVGSATHVGMVRSLNEDSLLARSEIGLFVVADGMGGHGGGDVASAAVVTSLNGLPPPRSAPEFLDDFEARMGAVNAQLRELARARGRSIVGTTLAAILIYDAHFAAVWCGDSRIYRWRAGALEQLSRDHSEVQDLIDRGILEPAEARTWPRRNVVTRALGAADQAELEIVDGPIAAGDRYLLCSDGLTGHVENDEIAAALAEDDPQKACDDLVALTLTRGASDNVSVIVVACEAPMEQTVRVVEPWVR